MEDDPGDPGRSEYPSAKWTARLDCLLSWPSVMNVNRRMRHDRTKSVANDILAAIAEIKNDFASWHSELGQRRNHYLLN